MEKIPDYVGKSRGYGRTSDYQPTRDVGAGAAGAGIRSPQMQFFITIIVKSKI